MKVKFQQTTGSRSYIAHCEALVISWCFTLFVVPYYQIYIDLFQMQRKARKDQKVPEPNVVEIFKDCHTSKKKGMSTPVKAAVVCPQSSCLLTTTYSDLCLELHGLQPMSITLFNFIHNCLSVSLHLTGFKREE